MSKPTNGSQLPTSLPDANAPLTLTDGEVLEPIPPANNDGTVEILSNSAAQQAVTSIRKKLATDLPIPGKQMSAIGVVVAYSLFGLDTFEIATALGITEDQVNRLMMSEAYTEMYGECIQAILDRETGDVRALFQQTARDAARAIRMQLESPDPKVKLVAAKDILDRAGHRPQDVIDQRNAMGDQLVIEVIKRDENEHIPEVETDFG